MTIRRIFSDSALFALAAGVAAGSLATGCGGDDDSSTETTTTTTTTTTKVTTTTPPTSVTVSPELPPAPTDGDGTVEIPVPDIPSPPAIPSPPPIPSPPAIPSPPPIPYP